MQVVERSGLMEMTVNGNLQLTKQGMAMPSYDSYQPKKVKIFLGSVIGTTGLKDQQVNGTSRNH
jgi:hypothetical protein